MKKITTKLLSLLLVLSMITVHFVTPIVAYADELVSVTIDVNGGNELTESSITGHKGSTLFEIAFEQDDSWIDSFFQIPKPRTYLNGFVNAATEEPFDPEADSINEDITIKLLWGYAEEYDDEINIDAEPPIVGDEYEINEEDIDFLVQNPTPMIGGLDFDVFNVPFEDRKFMVRECDDPIEENACLVPFEGKISAGEKYYLSFFISINENYYMENDIEDVLKINGEAPTLFDSIGTAENGDFIWAWVVFEIEPRTENTFEVQFNTDGGSEYQPLYVEDGQTIERPSDPEKENYIFMGWYSDPEKTIEYDFDDPIHENRTIYAKWEEKNVSITTSPSSVNFGDVHVSPEEHVQRNVVVTNNGNVAIRLTVDNPVTDGPFGTLEFSPVNLNPGQNSNVTIIVNKNADKAAIAGEYVGEYTFTATEINGSKVNTATVNATVNMVEDAPQKHTVTFDTDGGTAIAPVEVNHGESVDRPEEDPVKENYVFDKWCVDESRTTPYDFSNSITSDITIYARYTEKEPETPIEVNVTVTPNNINFGTFYIGAHEDLTQTVTITNNSDVAVQIVVDIPQEAGPFNIHEESNAFIIPAGEQQTYELSVDQAAEKAGIAGVYNGVYVFNYMILGLQLGDAVEVPVTVTVEEPLVEKVTVTFNTDGGTPVPAVQEIEKGSVATKPIEDPEKENYEFDTWCSDEAKTTPYDFTQPVNGDITIYARYTEEKVTVTFDTDGGTPVPTVQEIEKGSLATKPAEDPEKENYEFDTWCSDEAKTTPYDFSKPVNGDITIYAKYTEEKVTVTFDTDGGTPVPDVQEIEKGSVATKPIEDPEKENYEFDTWCADESRTTPYDFSKPVNGDTTIYARYTEVQQEEKVTVTFDTDGGTPVPAVQEIEKGSLATKPAEDPEKQNYEFDTWCYDETRTTPYDFSEPVNGDITIYARYNQLQPEEPPVEKVSVTFNTDGGTPVPAVQEIDKGSVATKPIEDPEKENYEFDTWCADEAKTTPYDFTQPVNGDITIYARYTEVQPEEPPVEKVTVTFNTDGGTPVPAVQQIDKGAVATRPAVNPEKENYEFDTWCSDEAKTTPYDFTQPVNGDITIYARYTEVQPEEPPVEKVTVTFNTDGGTPVPAVQQIDKGAVATRPAEDPEKENYEFDTWCSDEAKTTPYDFTKPVNGDITIYARYTEVQPQEDELVILDNTNNQDFDPEGENADEGLTIKVSGELSDLVKIEVDGVEVDDDDVVLTEGSTIATFTPEFLSGLSAGSHTVRFIFGSGTIEAVFNVLGATQPATSDVVANNPGTFDNIMNWIGLLGISSLIGISGIVILKKKHN